MSGFSLNLLLALVWVAITGQVTVAGFATGIGFGFGILLLTRNIVGCPNYGRQVVLIVRLAGFFLKELVVSNLRVAYEVMTPRYHMQPAIVALPLQVQTDAAITLLANLITLTPGTLSLDVSPDRKTLYIHAMYVDDIGQFRAAIQEGFEQRVRDLLEPETPR